MKKKNVVICIIGAVVVLTGAIYIVKKEYDKNRAVQESIQKALEEVYIPHVYGDIHEAFPVDSGHRQYVTSDHLNDALMYAYLYVYNEWAAEQDSSFEDLTLEEVREYLDSSEITVDYVMDNDLNTLYEIMLYGMSDRIRAYFDWYRYDGYPVIEEYMDTLTDAYLDLEDDHPELQLPFKSAYTMNYEQICEVIELEETGEIEDFDASLFTENEV